MADVTINSLDNIDELANPDLLVVWDASSNTAKNISGQQMTTWLTALAYGHGGIASIVKTSSTTTDPVVDTYTITYADASVSTFNVTNGAKGDTGVGAYVHLKWAAQQPTADNQMSNTPDEWIGIYSGSSSTAPAHYTSYAWYQYKGDKGDGVTSITWTSNSDSQPQGTPGTTDTYTAYVGSTSVGTFTVRNGADSLNGIPAGGSIGQLLAKSGADDYESAWTSLYTDTTSGYWKIRTWADGTKEAWYNQSMSFSCTSAYGSCYINNVQLNELAIPSLISNVELINLGTQVPATATSVIGAFVYGASSPYKIGCVSGSSGTFSVYLNVYVRGS
jgi:hypothetical protein